MTGIQAITEAIAQLPPQELAEFRAWFERFDATEWDRQLERDVQSGALDWLASEGAKELAESRCIQR